MELVAPASLFQMLPSTFLTVSRQFKEIGWGAKSWGLLVALPLCLSAFAGGFLGKPLGEFLNSIPSPVDLQEVLYLILLVYLFKKSIGHAKSGVVSVDEPNAHFFTSAIAGVSVGTLSSLIGIGGGTIMRPLMAIFFKMPENYIAKIARFSVFITALAGVTSHMLIGSSSAEHINDILKIGVALSVGGVFGFPIGAKMHSIVLKAGNDKVARDSFSIILFLLFICLTAKLLGFIFLSRLIIITAGILTFSFLIILTYRSNKGLKDEVESNKIDS
jgi:uncharacterized membrane protein YfcA